MEQSIQATTLLKLRKDKFQLSHGRPKKDGSTSWEKWAIQERSNLPRSVFFAIMNAVQAEARKVKQQKTFESLEPQIRAGLKKAAAKCNCGYKENKWGGYKWRVHGRPGDWPFLDVVILNYENHTLPPKENGSLRKLADELRSKKKRFRRMERNSTAVFRVAIVVMKNAILRLVPGKTAEEKKLRILEKKMIRERHSLSRALDELRRSG